MTNRRKALPPIDPKTDPKLRPLLEALKEITETGDGVRGDPLDRKLTVGDLVNAGLARLKPGSMTEFGPVDEEPIDNDPPGNTLIPPRPTGFNAIGSFGYVVLSWDIPGDLYLNHAFTNVYRSETDNFANAEMIGREAGAMYTDHIREVEEHGVGFYYWITFTSDEGREGPPNSTSGTYAEVIPDIGFLLDRLSGEINEEVLTPAFRDRLNGFQETISDLGDRYTLSVNNNGHVSGFTLYNTGEQSDFAVLADRFTIANQYGDERHPFIVTGGNTYIDTAFIRDASIQEGQLGPISFGKITDDNGNPVTTFAGKLKGELIEADNLSVAEAAKFYGNVYSNNYQSGVSGWAIYQSGNFELNEGRIRTSVQIGNTTAGDIIQGVGSIDNWRRPGSTLIDGNKIFTGDAYVDTLQIKGQAVTIPESRWTEWSSSFSTGAWHTLQTIYFNAEGGTVIVNCGFAFDVEDRDYDSGPTARAIAIAGAKARLLVDGSAEAEFGYVGYDKKEIEGGGGSDASVNAYAHSRGHFAGGTTLSAFSGTRKIELQAKLIGNGYNNTRHIAARYLQLFSAKR